MMDTELFMLRFIKYGMIMSISSIITSFVIVNKWIDAETVLNHGFVMMGTLILVIFLLLIAMIIQIVVDIAIEKRRKKKHDAM